jgi:uracil-DNA glycosylase
MGDSLEAVAGEVRVCPKCPLSLSRTHAVPGEGPETAQVMFIGEGPGYQEDRQGRPFVGPSGRYLAQLLATIGLQREQAYITNVVKCRPPENRDPQPNEITACSEYLDRQLALIRPAVVVTLGRFSMQRFFPGQSITRIHGQPKKVGDVYYLPLFHPAAALRRPEWDAAMQQDVRRIPELITAVERDRAAGTQTSPDDASATDPEQPGPNH